LDKYLPQKGDIAVFQPPNDKHRHGHIQMYNGTQWVSDFKQPRAFWPNKDYEDIKPPYVIYRPKDWKKPAGTPRP
jgi:type VI secretion system secreted protein VgrG